MTRSPTIIASCLLLAAVVAHAEPSSDSLGRAKIYFETGRLLYQQGDYEQAAKKFGAGYDLVPRPQFLLNIAQCYRKLDQLVRARELFEQYLRDAPPDEPERAKVPKLIAEIDARLAAQRPPPAVATSESEPAPLAPPTPTPPPVVSPTDNPEPTPSALVTANAPPSPQSKSFMRRHWWIIPVSAVVLGGAAVGIYFGTRSGNPCAGASSCFDIR